jgi:hypothetical protein
VLSGSAFHQSVVVLDLKGSRHALIFEEEDAGEFKAALLEGLPAGQWVDSHELFAAEKWERFDVVKVNKAGLRKRRVLLVSVEQHVIHTFKSRDLPDGAVTDATSCHKRLPLRAGRFQVRGALTAL